MSSHAGELGSTIVTNERLFVTNVQPLFLSDTFSRTSFRTKPKWRMRTVDPLRGIRNNESFTTVITLTDQTFPRPPSSFSPTGNRAINSIVAWQILEGSLANGAGVRNSGNGCCHHTSGSMGRCTLEGTLSGKSVCQRVAIPLEPYMQYVGTNAECQGGDYAKC